MKLANEIKGNLLSLLTAFVDIPNNDVRAKFGELARNQPADSARATRDESDLTPDRFSPIATGHQGQQHRFGEVNDRHANEQQ